MVFVWLRFGVLRHWFSWCGDHATVITAARPP